MDDLDSADIAPSVCGLEAEPDLACRLSLLCQGLCGRDRAYNQSQGSFICFFLESMSSSTLGPSEPFNENAYPRAQNGNLKYVHSASTDASSYTCS